MGAFGVRAGQPSRCRLWVVMATALAFASSMAAVSSAEAAVASTASPSAVTQTLSLSAPATAETRLAFTLAGYGYPVRAGRVVSVQRLSGGLWAQVGRATQSSTGRYSVPMSATSAGKFSYRAVALAWHGAPALASATRVVSVHAPYILLAPAPVFAGEAVKVSGTLPGVVSRPVWVQRLSGTRWVTLVKSTTTRTGSYATRFTAPAPGSYRVRTLAPEVTIGGRVRAQYVTAAKTLTVFASPHC